MLRNYLKVAIRNLFRQKFYTFINIFGLTIGIAVSLLIAFYVFDELSYDRFHEDADRIYQIYLKAKIQGKPIEGGHTCAPIAAGCREEIPGVEDATRISLWWDLVMRYEENIFTEKKVLVADSNFFQFFTFELIEGNNNNILTEPNQIVLTETTAKKYFNYTPGSSPSPVGKMMLMGNEKTNCTVVGVMKDPPSNSHFTFSMVLSMETWDYSRNTAWASNSLFSYIKIDPGVKPEEIQQRMTLMTDKHVGPEIEKFTGQTLAQWRKAGDDYGYFIQPMTDIHLHSKVDTNIQTPGKIAYVYLLSIVSVFIIIIACINFMNLSTARAAGRAKEVGIRKTVGAVKGKLVFQFLSESVILSAISTILAIGLIYILLPYFNQLAGKSISPEVLFTWPVISAIVMLLISVGILAGSYPAFYLTSFQPTEVLKGKVRQGSGGSWVRNSLVVFQFSISVFLIVSTLIIYKQLKLIQEKNLGYDKENVLIVENAGTLGDSKETFKKKVLELAGVKAASIANFVPPHVYNNSVCFPNGNQEEGILMHMIYADNDYLKTLGVNMASGRYFSEEFPSDSTAVIINKTGLKALGWQSEEGNQIAEPNQDASLNFHNLVGIVEDFNFSSLKNEIEPLIIFNSKQGNLVPVRLAPGNIPATVKEIEKIWKEMAHEEPFDYSFLDENFSEMFLSEQQLGKIFIIFTALAICIACLGLFALATFITELRSKEIGIRKAMGASSGSLVVLLTGEFTRLVLISIVVAIPAVIFLMNWWLENFVYKTTIGVMSFFIGGIIALFISWFTVSWQSLKAATANPTNALSYE